MLMSPIISNAKERHVRPDENNKRRLDVFQGRLLSYLPSSTSDKSGGQTSNNFNNVQNDAKTVNSGANNNAQICSRRQRLSNDDSLGESNCCVGNHNIKITGDDFQLVQMAKLVLDDYFRSNKFLQSGVYNEMMNSTSTLSTPTMAARDMIPTSQLKSSSPFADNSMGFNIENVSRISNPNESVTTVNPPVENGVARTRRTHFSIKDLQEEIMTTDTRELCAIPEAIPIIHNFEQLQLSRKDGTPEGDILTDTKDLCAMPVFNGLTRSRRTHFSRKDLEGEMTMTDIKLCAVPMVSKYQHDYEQLMQYSKSPLSLMLPKDWIKICEMWSSIVRK